MKIWDRNNLPLLTLIMVFGALVWLSVNSTPGLNIVIPSLIFLFLVVFTSTFSAPLGDGMASLTPMTIVASYLVVGLIPAAWSMWNTYLGEKLQTEPLCLTDLIIEFDYSKHPTDPCFWEVVEAVGTISEFNFEEVLKQPPIHPDP